MKSVATAVTDLKTDPYRRGRSGWGKAFCVLEKVAEKAFRQISGENFVNLDSASSQTKKKH